MLTVVQRRQVQCNIAHNGDSASRSRPLTILISICSSLYASLINQTDTDLTCSKKRQLLRGFTLIELLTVLAIISILATFVIFNVPSLLGAMGLNQGSRAVLDTLNFARETAVTKSVPTVVVIRISGANAWRRLAVFSTPVMGATVTSWTQVSQWQNLTQNAFIDLTYDPSSEPWTSPSNSIAQSPVIAPTVAIQDGSVSLIYQHDYYAVEFLPDGSLQNMNNIAMQIVKGHIINGVITVEKDSSGLPIDWVKLIIVQLTGHVKEIRKGQ